MLSISILGYFQYTRMDKAIVDLQVPYTSRSKEFNDWIFNHLILQSITKFFTHTGCSYLPRIHNCSPARFSHCYVTLSDGCFVLSIYIGIGSKPAKGVLYMQAFCTNTWYVETWYIMHIICSESVKKCASFAKCHAKQHVSVCMSQPLDNNSVCVSSLDFR